MRNLREGNAMQYPYLCEFCNRNETHGTNRFCDDCKEAGRHLEEHDEVERKYIDQYGYGPPDPYCDCCNKNLVSAFGETCTDCLVAIESKQIAQGKWDHEAWVQGLEYEDALNNA